MAAFDLHVHAIFHLCRATIPAMRAKKEGAIILVSSVAGTRGVVTNVGYQVVKGALPQFARALAREFANDNIRVNCVVPGWVMTERQIKLWLTPEAEQDLMVQQCLKKRLMPDDVARMVIWLAAEDGGMATSQAFVVDAGWL